MGGSIRRGGDAGKDITGKQRHILINTCGLLTPTIVPAADIRDRDGGVLLMGAIFGRLPCLLKLHAGNGSWGWEIPGRAERRLQPSGPGDRQMLRPGQGRRAAGTLDR